MDTWQAIRDERASFADAMAAVPASDYDKPSLCAGWSVRDVVGHMTALANMTPPRFIGKLAGSGFNFDRMVAKDSRSFTAGRSPEQLVDGLRARVDARTAPPGPTTSWLGETIVHGEDIFRALGDYRTHPTEHVIAVADFYTGSNLLIGAKDRIKGVTLRATDADWSHGTGPEVAGPAIALVLAMTGRVAALDDLTGDGVATLRER
ncbi:MAG TPA: maleylpyruvate isomerase family mycothiol-dependent enzyme, partial [Micromonosporaceae bacterium]